MAGLLACLLVSCAPPGLDARPASGARDATLDRTGDPAEPGGPLAHVLSSVAAVMLTGPDPGVDFGRAVAGGGDVNGDGYDDVVVGGWGTYGAYVYLGSAAGVDPASVVAATADHAWAGEDVGFAGDVDGDGYDDVILGDP